MSQCGEMDDGARALQRLPPVCFTANRADDRFGWGGGRRGRPNRNADRPIRSLQGVDHKRSEKACRACDQYGVHVSSDLDPFQWIEFNTAGTNRGGGSSREPLD